MKTAVITGGAGGIGSAITSLLAENGYNCVVNYNTSEEAAVTLKEELTSKGFSVEIFKADLTKSSEADSLIDFAVSKFGKIDLLINNAGVSVTKLITDTTDADWDVLISANLSSVFYCSRAALHNMIKNHSGCIINIASMWGVCGASCEAAYSASKAGVIGLSKALAKEVGISGIRVNCISPGVIDTKMNAHLSAADLEALKDETPLCKIGSPKDIAKAVLFLAGDGASFITGQNLSVDGGFII